MINNNIIIYGNGGRGITLTLFSHTLINNTITIFGSDGSGIYLSNTNNNTFSNININTNNTNSHGIYVYSGSNNATFIDSIINASHAGANDTRFETGTSGIINFTNVTLINNKKVFNGTTTVTLNVHWYLDAYANYTDGTHVNGANITAYNVSQAYTFSQLTNSTGRIPRQTLLAYWQNASDFVDQNNYTINAISPDEIETLTQSWNMTQNRDLIFTFTLPSEEEPPSDGNGGGGGGGGIIEQPSETQTQSWSQITPEQPATMTITKSGLDLTEITINVKETVYSASLTITKVDVSQADLGIGLPTGKVYQAFNITTNINETKIANVTIGFKVNKTWLLEQNETYEDVKFYRKTENVWNPWQALNVNLIDEDSEFYYFSALSPGLSTFMIFIGKYECNPGEKRCYNDQVQLCLGNYTWMIVEKCKYGCEVNRCLPQPLVENVKSLFVFYGVIGLISVVIIVVIYFIHRNIRRRRGE